MSGYSLKKGNEDFFMEPGLPTVRHFDILLKASSLCLTKILDAPLLAYLQLKYLYMYVFFNLQIGKSLQSLLPAIQLYSAFSKYILGDRVTEVLPLLQYVVEHGNTTVYEWSYGEPPLSVEPDPVLIHLGDDEQGAGDQVIHLKGVTRVVSRL